MQRLSRRAATLEQPQPQLRLSWGARRPSRGRPPTGSFVPGSPQTERGRQSKLTLSAAKRVDVTFDQRQACAANGGCRAGSGHDMRWRSATQPVILPCLTDARSDAARPSAKIDQCDSLLTNAQSDPAAPGETPTPFCRVDICRVDISKSYAHCLAAPAAGHTIAYRQSGLCRPVPLDRTTPARPSAGTFGEQTLNFCPDIWGGCASPTADPQRSCCHPVRGRTWARRCRLRSTTRMSFSARLRAGSTRFRPAWCMS